MQNDSIQDKLRKEFEYFNGNKDFFIKNYNGRFVVLKEHAVICEGATRAEALKKALNQGHELGTFLVQHVIRGDEETVQRFHSRVFC